MNEARIAVFWSRVQRGSPDGCWPWQAHRNPKGYGLFCFPGRTHTSTRVAWWISTGHHPGDMQVCHRCDEPSCCNPRHLFRATNAGNQRDSVRKGRRRHLVGDQANRGPILSSRDVVAIRSARAAGVTVVVLARKYGVSAATISHAGTGRNWRCLDAPTISRPSGPRRVPLNDEARLVSPRTAGTSVGQLARRYRVPLTHWYDLRYR